MNGSKEVKEEQMKKEIFDKMPPFLKAIIGQGECGCPECSGGNEKDTLEHLARTTGVLAILEKRPDIEVMINVGGFEVLITRTEDLIHLISKEVADAENELSKGNKYALAD